MTGFFLGVDGGQSSTTALIGDATGRVAGHGAGGPCNHVGAAEGREKFTRAIRGCLSQACAQAGLDSARPSFAAACLGFSGGPAQKEAILRELLAAEKLIVTGDYTIALSGATAGEPGIITIAGTGSISYGRNAAGALARVGGWGYLFGDEGGAFDLVRQALRASLREEEGWGPPTSLLPRLLEAAGESSANALMHRFYTTDFPRPRIASLARLVDEAAIEGDPVARKILENAARDLAEITAAVRGQIFQPEEAPIVAYIGGAFRSTILLEHFRMLTELGGHGRCRPPEYGPAAGALIEAYRAAGLCPQLSNLPESEK